MRTLFIALFILLSAVSVPSQAKTLRQMVAWFKDSSIENLKPYFPPKEGLADTMAKWAEFLNVEKPKLVQKLFGETAFEGDDLERIKLLVRAGAEEYVYGLKIAKRFKREKLIAFFNEQLARPTERPSIGYNFVTHFSSFAMTEEQQAVAWSIAEPIERALILEAIGLWHHQKMGHGKLSMDKFVDMMMVYQSQFEKELSRPSWGLTKETLQQFFMLIIAAHPSDQHMSADDLVFAFRWLGPSTDPISQSMPPANDIIEIIFDQHFEAPAGNSQANFAEWKWAHQTPFVGFHTPDSAAKLFSTNSNQTLVHWLALPQKAPDNRLYHRRWMTSRVFDEEGEDVRHATVFSFDKNSQKVIDSQEGFLSHNHARKRANDQPKGLQQPRKARTR